MLSIIVSILLALFIVAVFRLLNTKYKPPIFGIYQQDNKYYYMKFLMMFVILKSRQIQAHIRKLLAVERGESADGTVHVHQEDLKLEEKYFLGDHDKSIDAVYFNGASKEGASIICGVARRPHQYCDAFLYLRVNKDDLYLSPNLPDTRLKQNEVEQGNYKVQGINIEDFVPMRTWNVSYKGEMKSKNTGKSVPVEMTLTWSAHWDPFNYDTRMDPVSMARDLAREPWSADYFRLLKKLHQTHYEQMGIIEGTVRIDGKNYPLSMPCVRDHSFGPYRDWRSFHRYVLHFLFLENGDCFAVGVVSQPAILSHLTIGYYCRHRQNHTVVPVTATDFKMYQHGEHQTLPKDYGFTFYAGGKRYTVAVQVQNEDSFYIGEKREAKFYERWSTVEVNGIKGWGCSEWHYNNIQESMKAK